MSRIHSSSLVPACFNPRSFRIAFNLTRLLFAYLPTSSSETTGLGPDSSIASFSLFLFSAARLRNIKASFKNSLLRYEHAISWWVPEDGISRISHFSDRASGENARISARRWSYSRNLVISSSRKPVCFKPRSFRRVFISPASVCAYGFNRSAAWVSASTSSGVLSIRKMRSLDFNAQSSYSPNNNCCICADEAILMYLLSGQ
mmetsp:Transcript_17260/g.34998  ORF Transcript_17260/g.34998 Transcript_17260/m.34998 type:complete len:203 (-) Transcript_17260:370-978(-)